MQGQYYHKKYCIHIIFIKTQHENRRRFVTKRYSVVNTRNFLSSAFYRYSVDHCSSLPNKRGAIQITYCIYLLLRNSCLRRTTVTARIWKNLYVTGIVKNICVSRIIVKGNFVIDACWSHVPVSFRSCTKRFQWERHRD